MCKDNVVSLSSPEGIEDPLTELVRTGATRLVQQAIEAELAQLLAGYAGQVDDQGYRLVPPGYASRPLGLLVGGWDLQWPAGREP